MKSTKVMQLPNGVNFLVTTQQNNNIAETGWFVPGMKIVVSDDNLVQFGMLIETS